MISLMTATWVVLGAGFSETAHTTALQCCRARCSTSKACWHGCSLAALRHARKQNGCRFTLSDAISSRIPVARGCAIFFDKCVCPAGLYHTVSSRPIALTGTQGLSCQWCPAGFQCTDSYTQPERCQQGTFSEGGANACIACHHGWTTISSGTTAGLLFLSHYIILALEIVCIIPSHWPLWCDL